MQRGCASNLGFSNLFYICSVLLLLLQYLNTDVYGCDGTPSTARSGYDGQCGRSICDHHHAAAGDGGGCSDEIVVADAVSTAARVVVAAAARGTFGSSSVSSSSSSVKIDLTKHILNSR